MKIFKSRKFYRNIIFILIAIYISSIFITQQKTLDSYKNNQTYYASQIKKEEEHKQTLLAMSENLNSLEYIEEIAREKLDMYLPNEKIYIDQDK